MNYYYYDPIIRDIPGYTNYQISEYGEVYNKESGKELKIDYSMGYARTGLYKQGKMRRYLVHRLLAQLFIKNPENKECVDHIDGNPLNNKLENLRWATTAENTRNRIGNFGVGYQNRNGYEYWRARITFNKKVTARDFPYTDEGFEQAKQWRRNKEIELFGDYARKE